MKLTHIGISNFRSIGEEFVTIDLTKKINVLVGANNSGKSNVLRALAFLGSKPQEPISTEIDRHHRRPDAHTAFRATLVSDENIELILTQFEPITVTWDGILRHNMAISSTNLNALNDAHFYELYPRITNRHFKRRLTDDERTEHILNLAGALSKDELQKFPAVHTIPQFREIRSGEGYTFGGNGIIKLLAEWNHSRNWK
ncbi:MAG TPA: AAA family ATPase [Lacunisphaera sp.]|jgi:DNA repair ATPase RecN